MFPSFMANLWLGVGGGGGGISPQHEASADLILFCSKTGEHLNTNKFFLACALKSKKNTNTQNVKKQTYLIVSAENVHLWTSRT